MSRQLEYYHRKKAGDAAALVRYNVHKVAEFLLERGLIDFDEEPDRETCDRVVQDIVSDYLEGRDPLDGVFTRKNSDDDAW
jgi:hypothetical protein